MFSHFLDIWTFVILPLQVNQIGLYGGFIGNYEEAVEVVRRCSLSDPRFRTLAEVPQTSRGTPTVASRVPGYRLTLSLFSPEHDV